MNEFALGGRFGSVCAGSGMDERGKEKVSGGRMMKVVDMHCDTISELLHRKEQGKAASLRQNEGHIDLLRMRKGHYLLQNFALFVMLEKDGDPWERVCRLYQCYQEELEQNRDILAPVLQFSDIAKNEAAGKISAMLTVEEGGVGKGEVEKLRELYRMGVRMITLTWNFENEIGFPNFQQDLKQQMRQAMDAWKDAVKKAENRSIQEERDQSEQMAANQAEQKERNQTAENRAQQETEYRPVQESELWREQEEKRRIAQEAFDAFYHTPDLTGGLSERGREMVAEMERLGIIPDVSHLSDKGFYDVLELTKKPFVASHSNARAICPCVRNMTDDMIRRLSRRGGVMGLNFCADFLEEKPVGVNNPGTIAAAVRHARHIASVGGIEVLGLGSDFDGIDTHKELQGAQSMEKLWDALWKEGFSERELDKIFYQNVLRVYRDSL